MTVLYDSNEVKVEEGNSFYYYRCNGTSWAIPIHRAKELANETKISIIDSVRLLGAIRVVEQNSFKCGQNGRVEICGIDYDDKVKTLVWLLRSLSVEQILSVLEDLKLYKLKKLCESDNPVDRIKRYL